MKAAGVVAVMLPGTSYTLGVQFAPARAFLEAGVTVALATDFNPGTLQLREPAGHDLAGLPGHEAHAGRGAVRGHARAAPRRCAATTSAVSRWASAATSACSPPRAAPSCPITSASTW